MTTYLWRGCLAGTLALSVAAFIPPGARFANDAGRKKNAALSKETGRAKNAVLSKETSSAKDAALATSSPHRSPAPAGPGPGAAKKKYVVIGYVSGYSGRVLTDPIDAGRLTHINYSFVDIRDGRAWLRHEASDTVNLRMLVGLKTQNPALKILISIGGWSWSKGFSDAVLTDSSRAVFASSAIGIVATYQLDGVDIDWEFPGQIGDGNAFRPEDKQNYTLLFKKLREGLDSLGKTRGRAKRYFISTAVGANQRFLDHTDMGEAARYLDFVNIMSYDFRENDNSPSGHHTNLYPSKETQDPNQGSVDRAVHEFEAAGVPASKLVVGIGFYAHVWSMKTTENHGLYRDANPPPRDGVFHEAMDGAGGYTYIKDSLVNKNGFVRYWDKDAHAPYLFNADRKIFLSYDDEESVTDKCKYVEENRLAGVMFWDYESDRKGYLLHAISEEFGYGN
ncbi:MAG: glycoside hydrolase family 18 protein [Puia sp.]|nr:glycoside hydrolase family 18 protein [Puia sp.]